MFLTYRSHVDLDTDEAFLASQTSCLLELHVSSPCPDPNEIHYLACLKSCTNIYKASKLPQAHAIVSPHSFLMTLGWVWTWDTGQTSTLGLGREGSPQICTVTVIFEVTYVNTCISTANYCTLEWWFLQSWPLWTFMLLINTPWNILNYEELSCRLFFFLD